VPGKVGGWVDGRKKGVYHMGRKIGPRRERDGMSRRSLPVCVCSHTHSEWALKSSRYTDEAPS